MNSPIFYQAFQRLAVAVLFLLAAMMLPAQTTRTIAAGSYIIDMGVSPQTVNNALKPYGMVYDLLGRKTRIIWSINPAKGKDGVDFTVDNISFKGGPFVIEAEFRTAEVNSRITFWESQGVVGHTTTSSVTIPVYTDKLVQPSWTMDKDNGDIALSFFTNAAIPSTAHGGSSDNNWPFPSQLDCCDQIFVMPHADPEWDTHQRLFTWNEECEGSIWLGCHAGSALENMFNPSIPSQQTNFLAQKNQVASGGGPYFENALILWDNHDDGTPPYSYDHHAEPEMQFLGTIDAATQNGSEQIYIPLSEGWWPSTKVGVYDPDHPERYTPYDDAKHRAAVLAFGPGMGDPDRGAVMLEASHNIAGTTAARVAAQRAFFNFSLHALAERAVFPSMVLPSGPLDSGNPYTFEFTLPAGVDPAEYTATWSSSCGGTFTPVPGSPLSITFTPPVALSPQSCIITVSIANACGHTSFSSEVRTVQCNLQVTPTVVDPCFNDPTGGSISMAITNGPAPYVWNWTRTGGGSGSGSGTTISGLSAGTYSVTVTADNGAGCPETFQATVTTLPEIVLEGTITYLDCTGDGAVDLTVTGGNAPLDFAWEGPNMFAATTKDISGLEVGIYSVTVTDDLSCTADQSFSVQKHCIAMIKEPVPAPTYEKGDEVTYIFTIKNLGSTELTNVTVTDPLPGLVLSGNPIASLAAGATDNSITGTYTITEDDRDAGEVVNQASVTGTPPAGPPPSDDSDDDSFEENDPTVIPVVQFSDLSLSKSASDLSPEVGDVVTFTVTVSNAGPEKATGVAVEDVLPNGYGSVTGINQGGSFSGGVITWTDRSIAAGTDLVLTYQATVLEPGPGVSYTNTAQVTASDLDDSDSTPNNDDPTEDDQDEVTLTPVFLPSWTLTKTSSTSPNSFDAPGDVLTYDLLLENTGLLSISAVNVSDPGADPVPGVVRGADQVGDDDNILAPGEIWTYTAQYTVTQSDVDAGSYTNTATATGTPTGGTLPDATDSETVSGEQNPGLLVTKTVTASEEYEEGDVIAYEILVENTGNVTLTAPTVSDPQADAPGPQYVSGDADTDNLLDVGETWTFEAFHTAVEADMAAGSFTNTATATSDDPNGDPVSDDDDATATAIRADLAVTKTATPDPVTAGTSLTYTITVTNNGPYDAENVELEDILGTGQTITGALPSSGSWTAPFWTIGNLSVGQSEELELTVLVDDDLAEGSQVQNRAVVTSDTYDPDDTNNEDEVNPAVETEADLRITKVQIDPTALPAIVVVDPSVATPGEKLYYQLVVVNDGPSDAQQVLIEDMLPAGLSGAQRSFNFGSSWQTWTGSHTVISLANGASFQLLIRADIDPAQTGTLTNTAEVSSDTPDPDPSDNSSTEETQLDPMADLVITKEEINAPIQEGGEIVYRIHVQNVGPSDATNVIVTDALPGTIFLSPEYSTDNGSTWPNAWTGSLNIGTVAVGADYEFLIRAMLVDNNPDPNVNPVPNTASVESEDVDDPDPSNNMDMIETPLEEIADLAIVKAGPTSVTPGTEIEYTITVTNTGSTFTAASVNMVDVLDPSLVADPEYSLDGGTTWSPFTSPLDLGNMAPQEVIVVLLRGDVPSDVMSAIPNTAEVFSGTPDNDLNDNSSTISTPIQKVADLSIVKLQIDPSILPLSPVSLPADLSTLSIDPMQIGVGEDIYYLLVYMNHGPSDATNVIVTDNLPVEILNPEAQYCGQGGYAPWTGSYNAGTVVAGGRCIIVLRGEIAAGSYQDLTNTATVGSMDVTDSDPTNNSSTIVTELVLNPAITVTKSSSWKKFSQIGAVIPYTIAVENTGDAALTSVTLSDPLADAGSIAYQSGDTDMDNLLDPGETWTYTATHTVVAADRTVGSVVNVATVDAEDLRGDPIEEDSNPVTVEALFADDDQYTTPYETAVSASVAPNDTYPTGSTFDDSAGPLHGMLTFNSDGSFTYTPDAGFTGLDTFTYVVCLPAPNGMQCDTAIAVIVVGPDAVNDVFITPFDTDLFGQTDTNDVFVPGSSFELVSDVSHGILLFHGDGSFDYDPDFGFTGPDTFFYRICMPAPNGSLCDTAMVRILVSPQAVDDDLVLTPYETFIPGYDVGLNDFFPPGAQFATVTDPTLGTLNFGSNGNFTYQPAQQFSGLVPFTYQVFYNPADTANVLIVVGPKSNDNAYVTPYETPFTATVVPNDTFMAGSGFTVLDLVDHGTLSFMNDGSFSYTPNNGYSGTDTFTYEVCLPAPWNVLCDTAIAVILIAPNAVDDDYATPYQTPVPGSAGDNDTYPTGATFMALDTPPNGSLTFQTDGSFLYTPDNGFAGLDSFPYKVCLPAPNGTVCDTAFVRIQVDNAVILAVDDTYGPVTGSIGDPNLGNVLDNDQVNFLPTDITEVSIGIVTPATPLLPGTTVPVVNTATGTVSVPSGTPAGVYSITYRICEITYPFNCDTAIATVTVVEFPGMGVAKRIIAGPTNNNDGTYDLTYEILVENTGDVRLTQVQVTEELEQTFAGADAFAVVSLTSADFQVNAGFNGATDSFLLAGTDTLLVGESALIALIVQVTPGGNLGPYENLVTGSGRSPVNVPTEDDSQDGDDPDPDNDDDPGNNSDPTPVTFDCPLSLVNVPADLTVACDSLSQIIDNVQPSTPGCCLPITLDKDTLFTAGNCPGNYSLTFTWTATDDCGQMATATQVVTVRDTQAPTWDQAMPANVTVECDAVPAVASPIDASDNCDANATVTYTEVRTDGSCPENYTLTRTWTATDDCGNAVTHTQQIEVRDTQVPLWDVPLPANLTVECHDIPTPLTFTATDICDSAPTIEFTESQTPGSCPGNYTIFRTWKATDNCGNMSVRTRQLTVIDTLAPYWAQPMPADITVECDSVPAAASPIAALDSCDAGVSVTFAQTLVPGNCLNNYTLLRTWTATDDCGNSTTHTQEVTVRDTESPAWSDPMPQDLMVACDSVPVASTSYPAEDNCDTDVQVSYNETRTDGNCPDNYTLTRTWTAEDNCGNRTTHTQTIEVTDQLAPTWSQPMPADTLVGCDAVPPAFSPVNADDLCSDVTVSYLETRTDGNCAHNYMLLRTWTATDACGNASTFTQHISVTDTVAPVLMGLPADTVYVQCTEDLPVPATLTATDNCSSDVDIQLSESGDPMACINHFGLVRTWTATDACGNATTFVQCLMAMDTTAPVLQNLPPASVLLNCAEDVPAAAAVTATDNCVAPVRIDFAETLTPGDCDNRFTVTRTWVATDTCDNSSVFVQVITVNDTIAPEWAQPMSLPVGITVECDMVPTAAMPTATDNCASGAVVTMSETRVDGSCPENYTLTRTWTATDDCGNAVTHTQQIEVRDTQVPLWDVPLPANLTVECHDIPTPLTFTATDICDSAPTIEFTESQTPGSCPGNYTIFRTWKATDNCGNMSVRTRQLTVIDTMAPYWAQPMPVDITVECDSVPAAASPIAALDSCDAGVSVTFAQTQVPGNCLNNYTLLRTWTATDDCGNSTTHTQEVTVRDTESPEWSDPMPQDLMVACDSVPVASTSYPAEDNCDTDVQVSYNETRTDGNCPDNYTLTRTWTAEDNCGNRTTHTQTIEVTDQLAPTWSQPMPADTLVGCDAVPPAFSPVNADDLCSDVTVSYLETRTDGNCAHNYTLLRTWTATDACGNASTFTQHISVTDTVAPVLMGLPADTVYVQCTEDLPVPATLTATDNCSSDVDIQFSESGDPMACINHFGLVRTWTATDACGNATTFVQCLMAMDTTAPVLQNLPPASVQLNCAEDVPAAAAVTATDNCVAPVRIDFAETLTPGDCDNRFTVTRTWVATDTCDNSSVFVQVITVNDTIAPEWAQPMSLPVGITVECDMVPTAAMPTATDNCASGAVVTMSETRMDGSCPDNYTLTRTWTATDDCGNTTTHVQQILVRDTQVPLWDTILPLNETVACHELQAPHPFTASDNCDANVTVTISEESEPGSCPDSYTLTRTWTATDNCGNMNSHVQQVTVIDTLAPYWAQPMPADITVECDSVPAAASPIAALDSCDAGVSVTFAQTLLPGNCLNNYTLLRTWTATDDCGNSTTHTQGVTVRDTESPAWSDPMPQDLMVECDSVPVASTSYPATDNCDTDVQVSYQETRTDGNCTDNYTLTRTWTAEDNCGNRTTHTQTIQVGDVLPPTWSQPMPADTLVGCDAVPPAFSPVNADDLCSDVTVSYLETRTDGNCAHNYMLTRTWTATDACGNATVHTQSVSVTDTVAPVLQGLPDPLVQVSCTDEVPVPAQVSATDNCTVPVAVTLQTDSIAGGCANRYTLVRTWTATDSCGNESAFTQTVMVYDSVAPMLQGLPDPLVQVSCTEEVSVPATVTATDNCSGGAIVTLQTDSIPEGCANRYTLLRTWTATDVCGNTSAFTQTVMVYDSVAPLLQGLPPATLNLACAESVPTPAMVTATDNCASTPSVQFSEDLQPGNCPNRYTLLRTWTATDACGNSSSFVQTITVSDSIAPIWNQAMPGNVTVECSAVPAVPAVTASDNCSTGAAVNYNQVRTNGICTDAYVLTRTWSATDACGNAITHTQTIDVRDTNAPTWNQAMPGNVTVECDAVPAPLTPVAASDNCDTQVTVSFATVRIDGNCPGNYTLTRSWTATDNCGNALTHVQVLTVRDTQGPALSCQDITVELNANGQALITPAQVTATASDNCGTVSLSLDQTGFDCSEIGDVTVNLTATDDCGNTSSCQSRVTVQDNMPPQISGPATYTVNLDPGLCCQVVNWPLPTVSDNCPLAADALVQTAGPLNGTELCKDDSPWSVTYEVTDANGNNASFSFTVEMFEYQNPDKALACNDLVQISLDEDCDTEVKADMILEGGTYGCYDDYEVTILTALNEPLASSPFVGRAQIGKMWTVRLTDPETGNMCWGKILVEDKMKPVLVCRDTVIDCGAAVPDHPGHPVQDNCTPFDLMNQVGKHLQFADLTDHFDCAQNADLWKRITRVWTAVDESGNSSVCTQRIDLRRPTLATVSLPRNYDDKDLPSLDCQSGYPLPALTGEPLGCNSIAASYVDEVLTVCPGSYTVVRQWTLLEMCTANTGTHTQVIHVLDKTAPQVFCPDPHDIHVGGTKKISAKDCRAEVALPWIAVTDDCSTVNEMTVYARTTLPDGSEIIVNQPSAGGKFLFDVPVGFDYTFSYVATDACGNKAECSVQVSVQDVTPPVAVCETFHVVALTDSITWVNASSFDDGSNDACTMVSFAARRMPHSCNQPGDDVFRNKVPFYCCDGLSQEPLMVELRVRDGWGNDNFCMVSVTVVDLVKPVIWCPKEITVQCGMPYEPTTPDTLTVSAEPGMVIQGAYPYTYNVPLQVDGLPVDAQVTDIDLGLHISHEAVEQLRITLVGPQGQKAVVLNPGGCGNMPPPFPADISVTFNDEGAPFQCSMAAPSIGSISGQMRPQGDLLDVFDGTHPNGGWTLVIEDTAPLGQGLIHGVTLHIGHQRPLAWKPLVTDNAEECGLQIGYTDLGSPDNCPDGSYISRRWRVTDAYGNSSACVQKVWFEDYTPLIVQFPCDVTAGCGSTPSDTGEPVHNGDCEVPGIGFEDKTLAATDACLIIERTWTVHDWCRYQPDGNIDYLLSNVNPAQEEITFNSSINALLTNRKVQIGDRLTLRYLTSGTTEIPGLQEGDIYSLVRVSGTTFRVDWNTTQQKTVDITGAGTGPHIFRYANSDRGLPRACSELQANYPFTQWVQGCCTGTQQRAWEDDGDGHFRFVQEIRIVDQVAPQFSDCSDTETCSFEDDCGPAPVQLFGWATDECTPTDQLTYTWSIDLNGDGNEDLTGSGADASGEYPLGKHLITFKVNDQCGNWNICTKSFTVKDCKKPQPVCINGISVDLMATPNGGMALLAATALEAGGSTDNCTPYGKLKFLVERLSDLGTGQNAPDAHATPELQVTCDDIPPKASEPVVKVILWVGDEAGNWDYCETFVWVQDNMGACGIGSATLTAKVLNEEKEPVEQVIVELAGNSVQKLVTGSDGTVTFGGLQTGQSVTLTPAKDMFPLNGVSTYDLLLMQKHLLGVKALNSPYKLIAADVNKNCALSVSDIIELRRMILTPGLDFKDNTSWRFVDGTFTFPNPGAPCGFPETRSIPALAAQQTVSFVGVKVGDVSGDALPNSLLGSETRSAVGTLSFALPEVALEAGREYVVPVRAEDYRAVQGYQYTLGFDTDVLEFVQVQGVWSDLGQSNFGTTKAGEGLIATSWNSSEPVDLTDGEVLYTLTFRARANGRLSQVLRVNSRIAQAEAYNAEEEQLDVALHFDGVKAAGGFALYQNEPNPFGEMTTIGFELPAASQATLTVYDVTGKVLKVISGQYARGYHKVVLLRSELQAQGMLYYRLDTDTDSATKRTILAD